MSQFNTLCSKSAASDYFRAARGAVSQTDSKTDSSTDSTDSELVNIIDLEESWMHSLSDRFLIETFYSTESIGDFSRDFSHDSCR